MNSNQWISFEMGSETYVHPVDKIKEIIPYTVPVPVPGSPDFAEGILNVRGNVVTVLSSRALLGFGEADSLEKGRIIILDIGREPFGISVDSVGEIVTVQPDQVERVDNGGSLQLIKGSCHLHGRLYILTDFSSCDDMCSEIG